MKIIYYSPHPNLNLAAPSGPGTHMREVIAGFERAGHEVVPLIMGGDTLDQEQQIDIRESGLKRVVKMVLPESVWQTVKDWRLRRFDRNVAEQRLKKMIQTENPDLIYERGYYLMTSGVKVAKKLGIRHIIELNAPYPEEKMQMEGVSFMLNKANTCESEQVQMTDRVVVVSSALKDYLANRYRGVADKIVVTPNAVNCNKLVVDEEKKEALREKLSLQMDDEILGFVGSIFPYHGVKELLEVFVNVSKKHPSSKLLVVGDGQILGDLKAYAEKCGLSNRVIFTGNVRHVDVPNYIDLMDVTIMPRSNWYGSPVKIFEYGLLSKAIIAPDNVPVRDVMVHGEDGLLVSDDISELERSIDKLLNDSEYRQTLASNFHQKVLKRYNWDAVVAKILRGA